LTPVSSDAFGVQRLQQSTGERMKSILFQRVAHPVLMAIVALQTFFWSAYIVLAQEGGGGGGGSTPTDVNADIDINADGGAGAGIFGMWWVWVLIAVFLIVIVALTTRSRGRTE
jgi:hypothetical protein